MQDCEQTVSSDVGFLTEKLNEIMAGDEILLGLSVGTIRVGTGYSVTVQGNWRIV